MSILGTKRAQKQSIPDAINLKVHTFGLDPRSRYGLAPRRHKGGPMLAKLDPLQLYEATRGCAIAAQLAWDDSSRKDMILAMVKAQSISVELARRLLDECDVSIERDDRPLSQIENGRNLKT